MKPLSFQKATERRKRGSFNGFGDGLISSPLRGSDFCTQQKGAPMENDRLDRIEAKIYVMMMRLIGTPHSVEDWLRRFLDEDSER